MQLTALRTGHESAGTSQRPRRVGARLARAGAWTAVVLLVAVAAIFVASEMQLRASYRVPPERIRAARDSASIARGRHIATSIGGCVGCHGADLGGRTFIDSPLLGYWKAPNLTNGRGGAASRLSDAELEAAIRHGVRPDGRSLNIMPSEVYTALADDDVAALLAYLRHAPPVNRVLPPRRVGPLARVLMLAGQVNLLSAANVLTDENAPADGRHTPTAPVAAPPVVHGRYLAHVGGCLSCHGPGLSGGPIPGRPPGDKPAANITPTGLEHYDEAAFVRALREGVRPGGVPIDSTAMPWPAIGRMTDAELHALWEYLQSVPPRPYGNR